jgi:acyl-CoA thioester hydrolase
MSDRPDPNYPHWDTITTRWMDNDIYGHINNVNYYSFFDTAIAHYLIREGGLDPWRAEVIGYCVESGCRFHKGARFPDRIVAGLKVTTLGRSSVRYAIGIFRNDDEQPASGHFVRVHRPRLRKPVPIRTGCAKLGDLRCHPALRCK